MDWLMILFGAIGWHFSDERCKNPHFDSTKGEAYLKAAGYNWRRQRELETLWYKDKSEINRLLERDSEPLGRNSKTAYVDKYNDVKAILEKEGYKYYDDLEVMRDPYYRKLTGLNYYDKKKPDKYLMEPEQLAEFKPKQNRNNTIDSTVSILGILFSLLPVISVPLLCHICSSLNINAGIAFLIAFLDVALCWGGGFLICCKVSDKLDEYKKDI